MGRKLKHEVLVNKVEDKIELLSEYKGYRHSIQCRCKLCGYEWGTTGGSIVRGYGCPKCGLLRAIETQKWHLTTADFIERVDKTLITKIKIRGEYKGRTKQIEVECLECGKIWSPKAYYLYVGQGCIDCGHAATGQSGRKSHEKFVQEIDVYHHSTIEVLGEYTTGDDPITFKCLICDEVQEKTEARQLKRRGCVYCRISKGERKIMAILDAHHISYNQQYWFADLRTGKRRQPLRFDFAVFLGGQLSHLIEYDGLQHFKVVEYMGGHERYERQNQLDKMKDQYCAEKQIRLVRINYKQFNSMTIKDLL